MYVNVDYRISRDFSTLEISARGLVYPRSAEARKAAGLTEALPAANEQALGLQNAAYRSNVYYHLQLPEKAAAPADHVAAWKADKARLLHLGLKNGTAELARLLVEDLQRTPSAKEESLPKVEAAPGIKADLLAERNGGRLLRYPDGSLYFKASATALTPAAMALQAARLNEAAGRMRHGRPRAGVGLAAGVRIRARRWRAGACCPTHPGGSECFGDRLPICRQGHRRPP